MASTFLALLLAAFTGDSNCVVLHFATSWCQPCREMQPTIEHIRNSGWDVRSIDTDRQRPVAEQFGVENLPTLVILSEGREVDRIVGMASHAQIEKRLVRAAARHRPAQLATSQLSGSVINAQVSNSDRNPPVAQSDSSQMIVRGQSPGLSAVPRAVVNTLAGTALTGGMAANSRRQGNEQLTHGKTTLSREQAIDRAAKATVRIRVDEGNTVAYGTGTIVDVRGDEALVLTCGHLFRDMQAGTQLTVDLFAGTPQEINVPSQLIDFSADDVDIGLISMHIPVMIEPVEILPRRTPLRVDQTVFSFGCDHGQNPSRRDTRISRVNRYVGAANVEIVGAPAVGRSGGGLFDEYGRLIGVCNAANANEDEGIYAAAEVVYDQLERLNLTELFDEQMASVPEQSPPIRPVSLASNLDSGYMRQQNVASESGEPSAWPDESIDQADIHPSPGSASASSTQGVAQVICILRDSQGNDRMVTVNAPSTELIQRIQFDSQR